MLASPLLPAVPFSPKGPATASEDPLSFRPARDVDAFNSLLPPPIEFVEGSSSGALAVPEGKYQPINVSPKLSTKDSPTAAAATPAATPTLSTLSTSTSGAKNTPAPSSHTPTIDLAWPETCDRAVGLHNTGNTCFLNSALQCLLHTPPLLRAVIAHSKDKCRAGDRFCMVCAFRQVTVQAHKSSSAFAPHPVSNRLQTIAKHMRRGRQEDSHEFLRYAIDAMQKSCLHGVPPKFEAKLAETTWVHKIFGGKLRSRVSCQSCGHNSDTFDRILDLSLDIIKADSLKEALKSFVSPDYLKGADKYKCEKCKKHVNAEKRFTVHEAPPVLTVHLKRFSPLGRKIGHHVTYDETINLQPYMSEDAFGPTYTLYGIICHAGGGPNSGHYYAFVKSRLGRWFEMNDEVVTPIQGPPLNRKTAYILFYLRNKGQGLQAALKSGLNGVHKEKDGLVSGMKKRREWEVEDDEDVGEKVGSPCRKFIGPLLPSPMEGSSSTGSPTKKVKTHHDIAGKMDPQAEKVKQRIQATKDTNQAKADTNQTKADANQAKAEKALAVLESYDSSDVEGAEGEKDDDDDDVHSNSKKAEKGKGKAEAIVESDEDEDDVDQGEKDASTSSPARQPSPPPSSKHTPSSPIASNSFYGPLRPSASKPKSPRLNGTTALNKKHFDDSSDDDNSTNSSPVKRPTIYQRHFHSPDKPKKHKPFFGRSKMRMSMDSNNDRRGGYVNPFSRIGSENSSATRNGGGRMNTYGKRRGRRPRGL
ncbi:Ubiquitin carboxyl-terminal hydrolase 36 [Leucoagaricus sp. SymC.cos]|nr:Ubiquitin carboxyl-terminal hydrolase 36 [Leucoagaricus sp. SymC.cos]